MVVVLILRLSATTAPHLALFLLALAESSKRSLLLPLFVGFHDCSEEGFKRSGASGNYRFLAWLECFPTSEFLEGERRGN